MIIEFEYIKFKNILSFGNRETVINFKNGLNLITGENGSGKSSALLDVLSFCIYGQPYRKIKLDQLINWTNKSQVTVYAKLKADRKDTYEITRTLKPKGLTILKNGNPVKCLSSAKLTQEEIDKIIGIDYKMFKQIISLSINHNDPFLDLPTPKKREILEQIFNIDVFGLMLKDIKASNRTIKTKLEVDESSSRILKNTIDNDKFRIEDLKHSKENFESNKTKDIKQIDDKLKQHKDKLKSIQLAGKQLSSEKGANITDDREIHRAKKTKLEKAITEHNYEIKNCNKIISSLNKHSVCPTCNSAITEEYKESQIESLNATKANMTKKIAEKKKDLGVVDTELQELEDEIEKMKMKQYEMTSLKRQFTDAKSEIAELQAKKKDIQKRQFDIDIDAIENQHKNNTKQYKQILKNIKSSEHEKGINDTVIEILSENGIKSYMFEQLIPILNHNINEYLKLFGLSVFLEFDNKMEVTIGALGTNIENVTYYSFSEGEKKRIDMAILLSFISVTKALANWNCNLLVIDELLDSSIDEKGLQKLIISLDNMISSVKNLGIYIISHRLKDEYFSQFNSLMKIQKNENGFSVVEDLK